MIDKDKVAKILNNKFDVSLDLESSTQNLNEFKIKVAGFEEDQGLHVETKLALATIQSTLISEKYSGNTNEILCKNINDNFFLFSNFLQKLKREGYDFLININKIELDLEKTIREKKIPKFNSLSIKLKKKYNLEDKKEIDNLIILISEKTLNFIFLFFPTSQREVDDSSEASLPEGHRTRVTVNKYERDPLNRRRCLEYHGYRCKVCDISFKDNFGDIGEGFIHVHHIIPVSRLAAAKDYKINPIEDLVPVCPNCHYMLHKKKDIPYTVEELKNIIKNVENEKNN